MAKVLFFNAPTTRMVYDDTNIKIVTPSYPNLTLATLAGNLIENPLFNHPNISWDLEIFLMIVIVL